MKAGRGALEEGPVWAVERIALRAARVSGGS